MASATDTTKSDAFAPPVSARSVLRSPIGRLIFAGAVVAFAFLAAGALILAELRAQLVQAKIDTLVTQGELVRNVLAETATLGEPEPLLLDQRARQVMQALAVPPAVRARLFDSAGVLVADSDILADRVQERPLPELTERARDAAEARGPNWRLTPWRPDFTLEEAIARAAKGELVAGQRRADGGQRLVSVSMPVQRVEAVLGVLTLEAGDVDDILQAERRAMLPFVLGAALVLLASSALLATRIARPLQRLAQEVERLRATGATRLSAPDLAKRKDEIGDLAGALERMTNALADRIDANEHFAADVAHELKNPLTSIRSAVETTRAVRDPDARERLLAIIAADVNRMDRLITDIARASQLEAEAARSGVQAIDLGRLASDLTEIYSRTRRDGDAIVTFAGPAPNDAIVEGQEGPLGQVFRNLVDNAKSFSPPGGVVTVKIETEARRGGGVVRATVSDQGPGIPEENLETIFRRFYTDRPKGSAFGANSGLGLSIARDVVESHKGRIWAENIHGLAPGRALGARFIVELPMAGQR
jgi:two-component system sensor histidine kinase ChvG